MGMSGSASFLPDPCQIIRRCTPAKQSGTVLPGIHSPLWAPDRELTLKTAIVSETAMLMELMGK
jgi:hippurate hydrolase